MTAEERAAIIDLVEEIDEELEHQLGPVFEMIVALTYELDWEDSICELVSVPGI